MSENIKEYSLILNTGETLTIITPGAGGYGDPGKRDINKVLLDLAEGKISKRSALSDYDIETKNRVNFERIEFERIEREAYRLLEAGLISYDSLLHNQVAGPKPKVDRDIAVKTALQSGLSAISIARQYGITRQRVYQLRNKLRGDCVLCGEPAEPGRVRCATHLKINRKYDREWTAPKGENHA